jgi:hypothetical protein
VTWSESIKVVAKTVSYIDQLRSKVREMIVDERCVDARYKRIQQQVLD